MIKKAVLENFKQFEELSIEGMKKITLIGGKNNCGKTSLIEALFMLFDRGNPNVLMRQYIWRGVQSFKLSSSEFCQPYFHNYKIKNDIRVVATEEDSSTHEMRLSYNFSYNKKKAIQPVLIQNLQGNQEINEAVTQFSESLDFKYFHNRKSIGKTHLLVNNNQIGMDIETLHGIKPHLVTFIASTSNRNSNENANRLSQIEIAGETNKIVNILQIIEPKIKSLSVVSQGNQALVYADVGLPTKTDIQFMGEGTSKLLTIILAIASSPNGVVLIDEIENGFHHSIQAKLWKIVHQAAIEYNCQVIATTHSYEIIKNMSSVIEKDNSENFTFIRLDTEKEEITPKYYPAETLKSAVENNWEVR